MADEAHCVGPAPSNQSYLSMPAIYDVITKTGAEAVGLNLSSVSRRSYGSDIAQVIVVAGSSRIWIFVRKHGFCGWSCEFTTHCII